MDNTLGPLFCYRLRWHVRTLWVRRKYSDRPARAGRFPRVGSGVRRFALAVRMAIRRYDLAAEAEL